MADATDLQSLCLVVLSAAETALDTIPGFAPALEGAPERTFISAGTPALDCCDQLAVAAMAVREAATQPGGLGAGTRHKQNFRINLVGVSIWISRCLDTGVIPPPAVSLTALAEQTNADGWALWNGLWNEARSGDLVTLCDEIFFDSMTALQPSGQCSGWLLQLRIQLAGYNDSP